MLASITASKRLEEKTATVYFIENAKDAAQYINDKVELDYIKGKLKDHKSKAICRSEGTWKYFVLKPEKKEGFGLVEALRKSGAEICTWANGEQLKAIQITSTSMDESTLLALAEGASLANYQFLKYKTEKKENSLEKIAIYHEKVTKTHCQELEIIVKATFAARDLVNEPVIYLTAEQLSKETEKLGKEFGFTVDVMNKSKIKSLKMGGLLAVNVGSPNPPTFNILEYKPNKAINKKPYILVGKGVVYDTGGLSLKPTPGSMDYMKSDMAGGAAVIGAFCAIAGNKLPIHVVGLIPATENRLDGNAITPGDVITMFGGQTVEILNTDAEGRLILADALVYAKKYKPELVIDLATLTGAAVRAIGVEGAVMMGTASEEQKNDLQKTGLEVHERLVEFPLWEEYEPQLKSDIADFSNLGGANAGATTAGIFLQKFTDYPWMHLDIAGPAYLHATDSYRGKNGTGFGVRLLYQFLKKAAQ